MRTKYVVETYWDFEQVDSWAIPTLKKARLDAKRWLKKSKEKYPGEYFDVFIYQLKEVL